MCEEALIVRATYGYARVSKTGNVTLSVIDEQPERLAEVSGVGPRLLESINRA